MNLPPILFSSSRDDDEDDESPRRLELLRGAQTMPDEHPDRAFVDRIRAGEAAALDALVQQYFTPLARFAFHFTGSYDAAEDVAQGVLLRVWERRERWNPTVGVRAYLFAAVRNAALNVRKHDEVVTRQHMRLTHEVASSVPPAEPDDRVQERRRLREALAGLTERQRIALRLRYEQELAAREIGVVLEISTRAVERLLARALVTLREALERE